MKSRGWVLGFRALYLGVGVRLIAELESQWRAQGFKV